MPYQNSTKTGTPSHSPKTANGMHASRSILTLKFTPVRACVFHWSSNWLPSNRVECSDAEFVGHSESANGIYCYPNACLCIQASKHTNIYVCSLLTKVFVLATLSAHTRLSAGCLLEFLWPVTNCKLMKMKAVLIHFIHRWVQIVECSTESE